MIDALNMLRHGPDGTAGITDCQGYYLYRNMRLIEFGSWKGNAKTGANDTCARIAVYPPVGLVVNDPKAFFIGKKDDFTTNPPKTELIISPNMLDMINEFRISSRKWFKTDPKQVNLMSRGQNRSKWDKPKKGPGGKPPTIINNSDVSHGEPPLTVVFSASHISGPKVKNWKWNFGDGNYSSEQNPTHTFDKANTLQVTVTGTAANGKAANKVIVIDVQEKGAPKPNPKPKPKDKKLKFEIIDKKGNPVIEIIEQGDEEICKINTAADEFSELADKINGVNKKG
jgi:hypothetical protein